ncbi:MAG: pyruvate dehydrogenase (acetyl-transferring) E1 component subunit alpha [Myxococcales bacterium]|nr:pyruvate dehydrogenase (acetyl-transferring) E1 component subunit alpha [Myxococcales bacterium]MDH3485991.1 pyruvate dehydrogenase (acetyl-transferring) E1 component subunit alpha [Myxococcales bacterium]
MGTPLPDKDDLLRQYRSMMRIRRFEEEAARNYAKGRIGGFLHLYIGQEAIAVGAVDALRDQDYVFQTYRDHGIALARGMPAKAAMAELFGKDTGCSRGMGGSMHFFDVERNFLGGWAIVGGHMALAAGTAFKSRYNGEDRVTICFFGEGSTNIGGFHEAMSLAGLWKLPIVFVCENNQYAMGTPLERTSALKDLSIKAKGYAMAGARFEGHDVTLVQERIAEAVDRARTGAGPTFIEVLTYRFRGHSMSDPAKYRSRTELEQKKQLDPIQVARERILELGVEEAKLDDIDLEVDEEIDAAVKFAEESEPARREVMLGTVYAEEGEL